jgi:hypothetical protein
MNYILRKEFYIKQTLLFNDYFYKVIRQFAAQNVVFVSIKRGKYLNPSPEVNRLVADCTAYKSMAE